MAVLGFLRFFFLGILVFRWSFALRFRCRLFLLARRFADKSRVDAIADFKGSGLNVSCGKLADFFTGDFEICCSAICAYGGEDGTSLDVPGAVGLNKNEVVPPVDGSDSANELGLFFCLRSGRLFDGFVCAGAEEKERDREGE